MSRASASGAPSAMPSSQLFHSGTALPPFSPMTASAASVSIAFTSPAPLCTAFSIAVHILCIVSPWSASPKRESISVSSASALLTSAQAFSSRRASSSLVTVIAPFLTYVSKFSAFYGLKITYVPFAVNAF